MKTIEFLLVVGYVTLFLSVGTVFIHSVPVILTLAGIQ